ncbi:MAG: hypothetical protein RLZZ53_32 [Acidobacteriota bacterium]
MAPRNLESLRTATQVLVAVFGLTTALYVFDLANTPVYFGGDEAHFAVGAHALATTGRNTNGDLLPVFVSLADPLGGKQQAWGDTWYQPLLFYIAAVFVKVLPFNETVMRLPMALVGGLLTPLMLFAVARRFIGHSLPALVAALIVALSPTHVVLSRQALDYVLPLPFLLGWLWCLHAFRESRQSKYLTAAGLLLGVGCYSYIASWALMPVFLVVTWIVAAAASREVSWRQMAPSAVAFAFPVSIGILWVLAHPEMLEQTVTRYGVTEGPKQGPISTYLSLLHPNVLFVRGGPSLVTSTSRSGFVLLPVTVFLAAGAVALWRRRDWMAAVIVTGLLVAPVPAAFKGEPAMIQRAMYLLPFLALLGGFGCAWLWQQSRLTRAAAILALVAAPLQFGYFYFDYFTHYKFRSAFYYDPAAFRDVATHLMSRANAPAFYFTTDVDDTTVKWRYYTTVQGRTELLARTHYIEPNDRPVNAAPGSALVTYDLTDRLAGLAAGGWYVEQLVHDVDNRPAAVILRKR